MSESKVTLDITVIDLMSKVMGTALLLACGATTDELDVLEAVPGAFDLPPAEMVASIQAAIREHRNERGYVDMGHIPEPETPAQISEQLHSHRGGADQMNHFRDED